MRKTLVIFGVLVLAALMTSVAFAGGGKEVVYTVSIAELEQGGAVGGALLTDGTAIGGGIFSTGSTILRLQFQSWTGIDTDSDGVDDFVSIAILFTPIKPSGPAFLLFAFAPVTGTPQLLDSDGDGNPDFLIRVTLAN